MAPAGKSKVKSFSSPSHLSSSLPSSFIPAISTVAVAQICLSAGYSSTEPAALRSLSAIAALYLQTLARSAASIANSRGRTQSNLLDVIRAMEDLSISQGFPGASDPTRLLLKSSVLNDLRSFVRRVNEIPFPKPIKKREGLNWSEAGVMVSPASFLQTREEPPGPHVPRWLPCFPEQWEMGKRRQESRERGTERRRWEEGGGVFEVERGFEQEEEKEKTAGIWGRSNGDWNKKGKKRLLSMVERERVKFELVDDNSITKKKKMRRLLLGDDE